MIAERTTEPGVNEAARTVAQSLRARALSPLHFALIAAGADLLAAGLAFWFATGGPEADTLARMATAAFFALLTVGGVWLTRGYRPGALRRGLTGFVRLVAIGVAVGAFLTGPSVVAPLALALPVCAAPGRGLVHLLVGWARDFGLTERRAVLIGGGLPAARLIAAMRDDPANDIRICGIFDDRADDRSPAVVSGIPHLGKSESLLDFARAAEIDMAIVTLPVTAAERIRRLLAPLEVLPIDIRLSTLNADSLFHRRQGIEVLRRPLGSGDLMLKRLLDIVGASIALAIFALPMALTALAIRLDSPGPILFRQTRHGYNHRPVEILKFRSMRSESCDPAGREVVTRGDDRVTRVGRFIRRASIDELPQLINVLKGDLSLVGPRPHVVDALSSRQEPFAAMVKSYAARHRIRPGVTGWAQINGWRGEIDAPEKLHRRFEHDLFYIENWSIWFDLKILVLTPVRLFDSRGAY